MAALPAGKARLTIAGQQPIRLGTADARAMYTQPVIWTTRQQKLGKSGTHRGSIALALIGKQWLVVGSQ